MPKKATAVVQACCCLHNLLIEKRPQAYLADVNREQVEDDDGLDLDWQCDETLLELQRLRGTNATKIAKLQRDHIARYLNSVGAVSWQNERI